MDKPLKWFTPNDEEIPKEELVIIFQNFLKRPESTKPPVEPPKDLREFEDRIGAYEESLRKLLFGLTYDMETGKTLKREKTAEAMVEALLNYEKQFNHLQFINEHMNPCGLLKLVLEKDAPLVLCDDIHLLGVERDRSGLSLPHQRQIAVQAAAQVLWYLKKGEIPDKAKMAEALLNAEAPLYDLLELDKFEPDSNPDKLFSKTIAGYVSKVCPLTEKKQGRTPKTPPQESLFETLVRIPGVFLEDGRVNFLKLGFTITCITRILTLFDWPVDQIKKSPLIRLYQSSLKFYLPLFISTWVKEAAIEKGSIFTSKFASNLRRISKS